MNKTVKVLAPAKINYSLKVGKKREDGFHPIESFMQSISLFDVVEISVKEREGDGQFIHLSGNSEEIPYDKSNLAWRACELFFSEKAELNSTGHDINIYIEKNIPVCAGLAGGSTDAAAVFFGLNEIFGAYSFEKLHDMCAKLGSDLNFCLEGGAKICKGRGEILENAEFKEEAITLVKPLNLKISAKEAYQRFDELREKSTMPNDLEFALLPHYKELQRLHAAGLQMSGSGPSFFIKGASLPKNFKKELLSEHLIVENLKAVDHGVKLI